jgi:SM-20-related protein
VTDTLLIPDFLDPDLCKALRVAMRAAQGAAAGLIGEDGQRPVRPEVRRATQVGVGAALGGIVAARLAQVMPRLAAHFDVALASCEAPQFLRYGPGDYFVAHQDGNTPLVFDRSRDRRVSVIVFLSAQSDGAVAGDYGGGSLVFHDPFPGSGRAAVAPAPGTLIAFRAETTHEVAVVTSGERLTIASWYS